MARERDGRNVTLTVLDGGTSYHKDAIHGPRYAACFDRVLYAPDLVEGDLDDTTVLIVPDRTDPRHLRRARTMFLRFLERGRTLVVFGETESETWLPGVAWSERPTNFWWWLEPGAVPEQQLVSPRHELFDAMPFADTVWHYHGILQPPDGAETLIAVPPDPDGRDGGGALLYDDRVTTAGRLLVTTLDPFYHHGSNFMPATTRFLDGFLPWARKLAGT